VTRQRRSRHLGRNTPPRQRGPRIVNAWYTTDGGEVERFIERCGCPVLVDATDPERMIVRHLHRHACQVLVEARRGGR
jgi:hypothetical protein